MNSPPLITSRANRRRALSLDDPTTPLLRSSFGRRRVQDEAAQRILRLHVVSPCQCWSIYSVLILLYALVFVIIYFGRRPASFVPAVLPDLAVGDTVLGTFNPNTALKHLEAITTVPHPFNSRANSDITKRYLRHQFQELLAEAVALGRRNVRYDDGMNDNSTWVKLYKSRQQQQMEDDGLLEPADDSEELHPENIEVVQGDNMVMWIGGVVESMDEQVPVRVEIDFDQEKQNALMISAHFDSVSTSYGATDDGGGVAVALALMRHFIHHPVEHTLIFNINNAEEEGLLGAAVFMGALPNSTTETGQGHRWKKYVKAFINLEGAGSGGPSLLFRASNSDIIRQYSDNAPFPHASVFSNDIFQLGLVASDTDYSIFIQHGIPGLDIAFYQQRSMYHSTTDYLPIQSLYHMGSNVQATITGLCNSPYLDQLAAEADISKNLPPLSFRELFLGKSVFYDILGKYMFMTELWAFILANILLLGLGLPILTLAAIKTGKILQKRHSNQYMPLPASGHDIGASGRSVHSPTPSMMGDSDDGYTTIPTQLPVYQRPSTSRQYYDTPKRNAVLRTFVFVILTVVLDLATIFGASKLQWHINPLARHSQPWLVIAGLGALLVFVNTIIVSLFTVLESSLFGPLPTIRGFSQWTIALGLWWWLVVLTVGTGFAGWAGTGIFYGASAFSLFSGGAAIIQIILNFSLPVDAIEGTFIGMTIVPAISIVVPCIILMDLITLVLHMTSQSLISIDGGIIYILYGLLMIPIILPMLPIISRGRNFKTAIFLELSILACLFWVLSQVDPFTDTHPASLHFLQHYNQTANSSYVNLATSAGPGYLQRLIQDVPSLQVDTFSISANMTCTLIPIEGDLNEMCQFRPSRQVFQDKDHDIPLKVDWISKPKLGMDGWREGSIRVQAMDSRFCSVRLSKTAAGQETQVWMEHTELPLLRANHRPKNLYVYLRDWNRSWIAHLRVKQHSFSDSMNNLDVSLESIEANASYEKESQVPFQVVCGYEDWSSGKGYASTYNEIFTHIPSWSRLKSLSHQGLFSVGVDMML